MGSLCLSVASVALTSQGESKMKLYVFGGVLLTCLIAASFTRPSEAYVVTATAAPEPDIDGILETVGIAIIKWLADQIPIPAVTHLIDAILNAWVDHERKVHYWEHVEENVKETCGQFINQKNIDQVVVYKTDVARMLDVYQRSPVHGDGTYPDKNTQADAITTSIITNRYLVEAALMPWSLTLHFVDIASVHIMILKDVATAYSFPGQPPSQWWQDVSNEIAHYDNYTMKVYNETINFRKSNIRCSIDTGPFHDTYHMTDLVTGKSDSCTQVHGNNTCADRCQAFQDDLIMTFNDWHSKFVGQPLTAWRNLKVEADKKVFIASSKRNPAM